MKMRKFFHVAAIMISSFVSTITHGKAQDISGATSKEKKSELAKHHRRHNGSTSASDLAAQDPPARSKIVPSLDSDDIKNSKHAATWASYMDQEGAIAPAPKLDPAVMANAERDEPAPASVAMASVEPKPLPGDEQSVYPWKRGIVTTTFWVGEDATKNNPVPNRASCWDPHWAENYGGNDPSDPSERTSEYIPAAFTPAQNPFYVALPYNDMEHCTHKAEAAEIIPWFAHDYKGPTKSVCQGRWIAIRFGNKVCYAQWEDAGPFRTDHWQYVFGKDRPRWNLNRGAGLDVSPAVRDFLGMNSTDVTDWKFVDFVEVPTGPWAKYGDNNTFVQNARRAGSAVVDLAPSQMPLNMRNIIPGMAAPTVELQ
jgi:hypothetical protein